MRTPNGGHRSTQWVLQYRIPPVAGTVTEWQRGGLGDSGPEAQTLLTQLRTEAPSFEWRAIRIETVQRVEEW